MEWINNFISALGAGDSYFYRDQADVYKDIQNGKSQPSSEDGEYNGGGSGHMEERHSQTGKDVETGEEFEVEVKNFDLDAKNKEDKKEKEWLDRETMVTFTSLNDSSKSVQSSIDTLCGGRYKFLKGMPAKTIAIALVGEHKNVFGYTEASMASYSTAIDAAQALRLAKTASSNNVINHADYEKIQSKLSGSFSVEFDRLLSETNIKVAYPMPQKIQEEIKIAGPSHADYTLSFIKEFKEYRVADLNGLKIRTLNVLSTLNDQDKLELTEKIRKDSILKNIL